MMNSTSTWTHLLDVPYDDRQTAQWAKARWNPQQRAWTYTSSNRDELPAQLAPYAAKRHSWQAWCELDLNSGEHQPTAGSGIVLHPHQVEAADMIEAAWVAGRPGFLLADEVGVGKTFSALAGVNRIAEPKNVLVLCPLSVTSHWRASIDALGSHHRFAVINYDRAKNLLTAPASAASAKRTRTKNQRTAAKGTSTVTWDVIIADESHLLKNPTSQRSAAVRQLQGGKKPTAFMIWCSATAGQNPTELAYLSRLISATTGSNLGVGLDDFEQWCRDLGISVKKSFGGLAWNPNQADLDMMHELLFSDRITAIRRQPTDIAGWPELERIAYPVELTHAEQATYHSAWGDVRAALFEERAKQRQPKRSSPDSSPLVALLRFRQKASTIRIPHTVELICDLLSNGRQVAVSAEFRDSVDAIVAALTKRRIGTSVIHGGMTPDEREQHRVRFQQGVTPVIVFTVKEGISLHAGEASSNATSAPRATVIHDPRWDAISTAQIEGRTWRDGQHSTSYHTYADGTAEQKVVAAMLGKLEAMKTILDDDDLDDVLELIAGLR